MKTAVKVARKVEMLQEILLTIKQGFSKEFTAIIAMLLIGLLERNIRHPYGLDFYILSKAAVRSW